MLTSVKYAFIVQLYRRQCGVFWELVPCTKIFTSLTTGANCAIKRRFLLTIKILTRLQQLSIAGLLLNTQKGNKVKQVNVYSISELSDSAKERAHRDYLSNGFEYHWLEESLESIKAFCDQFGVKVTDWSLSTYGHSYIKTNAENHHFHNIGKSFIPAEFPTGYCLDEDLRQTYLDAFKRTHSAFMAFREAIDTAVKSIVSDMENQETLEYFIEHAEANKYQFLEDGRKI